jgi:two-component system sensor histidine kinase KdpD
MLSKNPVLPEKEVYNCPLTGARMKHIPSWNLFLKSLTLVAAASILGEGVQRFLAPTNLVMLYLLAVVVSAIRWGRGPAIFASFVSVLAFDFLFVPPRLNFSVADSQYLLTFAGLLIVALVISDLAAHARDRAIEANQREAQATLLYNLSRDLAAALDLKAVLEILGEHAHHIVKNDVALFLPEGTGLKECYATSGFPVGENEIAVATLAFQKGLPTGWGTEVLPSSGARYLPLKTPQGISGVLAYKFEEDLSEENKRLLHALTNQAAVSIDRAILAKKAHQIELLKETEKLQKLLLNSVSHDLRTPLVSIKGALSSLLENEALDPAARRELLENAYEESDRLNQIVGNLLDMTRVETGTMKILKKPFDLGDVIGVSLQQIPKERLGKHPIVIHIPPELPELPMDLSLMMKTFVNILDNALKYSPANAAVEINARIIHDRVHIEFTDHGIGIPSKDLSRIFDKFYRSERSHAVPGTGLGLAICKGVVEAHQGEIWAESSPAEGTRIFVSLPLSHTPEKTMFNDPI